jgi:hypothetical protein
MKLFAVTVLYVKTDGADCSAVALVGAPDAAEAILAAAEGVRALPHCREIVGGDCEELTAPNAQAEPNARASAYRPHGATVH